VIPVFRGHDSEWTLGDDEATPAELEPAVAAATSRGAVPVREMAMGRPEHALVKVAGRDGTDLLVVGHRGVSGVRRMLLGSVSEYCTHHAPCSVLVARPGSAEPTAT
jgi:nucleotide-binding universal stress UspA family protein